ncbi:MAG: 50S ribosomal protein L24 [Planctomycetota bacterium]
MPMHVRKGDQVMITSGALRGRTGEVSKVEADKDRVYVKGLNLRTKHVRPTQINPQGQKLTKEAPIHISNVSPVVDGKPTRVRFVINEDGSKDRVAASTGQVLSRVAPAKKRS